MVNRTIRNIVEASLTDLLATKLIRDIPDFPKPGIIFKDITPVLSHNKAFQEVIDLFVDWAGVRSPDVIVGVESRGFVFGAPVALAMGIGFVPVRKVGKLPYETIQEEYSLEYGTNIVEVHKDAILPGQRALIIDDLLATGGTASASARLVEALGAKVAGFCFLIELEFLQGRAQLSQYDVQALIQY
jgi:adenine phosphoribosyltransferase